MEGQKQKSALYSPSRDEPPETPDIFIGTDGHILQHPPPLVEEPKKKKKQGDDSPARRNNHQVEIKEFPGKSDNDDSEKGDNSKKGKKELPVCYSFRKLFTKFISRESREVYLKGECSPPSPFTNEVKNRKYNIITFLPLFLFNQFKAFFNCFFLGITLSQFYPPLQVGFLITYIGPLAMVLSLSMLKEIYDDFKRWLKDRKFNSEKFTKITAEGETEICSSEIKCGDIIKLTRGRRVPADMVLLWTNDPNGVLYLKTDQLDGETDWKVREAITETQKVGSENLSSLIQTESYVQANPPSREIYDFKGSFYKARNDSQFEPLRLKNTMWSNTILAVGEAAGLVIYTGKETRMEMNARSPRTKIGKTDDEINRLSMLLFCFVFILAAVNLILSGKWYQDRWYIYFVRNILLLSSIIPISLRVNIDFAKLVYSLRTSSEKRLEGTVVRNMSIPEELGRIQYLLSDKTGTLTKNDMVFKKISTVLQSFTKENIDSLKELLKVDSESVATIGGYYVDGKKRSKQNVIRELLTCLMVCHNVTPTEDEGQRLA